MSKQHPGSQRASGRRIWNEWTNMWNERPALARTLVAPVFALHLPAPVDLEPSHINSPAAVEAWVTKHRAKFRALTFLNEHGPFVDEEAGVVAGPWCAEARLDESPRWMCGMDTIAFRDEKVTEYWSISTPAASREGALAWARAYPVPRS